MWTLLYSSAAALQAEAIGSIWLRLNTGMEIIKLVLVLALVLSCVFWGMDADTCRECADEVTLIKLEACLIYEVEIRRYEKNQKASQLL